MNSTKLALVAALAASTMIPSGAEAQAGAVTLDQLHPAETAEDGFTLSRPDDRGHLRFGAQLVMDYAYNPLVFLPPVGAEREVVRNQLAAHVGVHLGLFDRLVVYASMPFNLLMDGGASGLPLYAAADGGGLGDTHLGARLRLFGERRDVFALALAATFTLPTAQWSNATQRYSGERGATALPELLGELRFDGFRITLNVGARLRFTDEARLETLPISHELTWGGGLTLPIVDQERNGVGLTAHVEVFGASTFEHFGERETSPVEALGGLRIEPVCGLQIGLAGGGGLTRGYGAPDARGLVTVGFSDSHCRAPEPVLPVAPEPVRDTDRDGVSDDVDACVADPEDRDGFDDADGCPELDNDHDGIPDANDSAPLEPEDRDGFEDADGAPDPDDDGDGLLDASDACPREAEDVDGFEDADGCPDVDNDGDGVLDADDQCPTTPGTLRAHGCTETTRIDETTGTIVIYQRVEFSTGRDRIVDRSFGILQEVTDLLLASPQITRLRVEGHTDDRGRDAGNLALSQRRAASVVRWLVAHGVDASRLEGWGCGELHPIDANDTTEGREDNRRVEFHLVAPPPPPSSTHEVEGCVEASAPRARRGR